MPAKLHLKFKADKIVTNQEMGGPFQRIFKFDLVATGEIMDQRDGSVIWTPCTDKTAAVRGELGFATVGPDLFGNVKIGDEIVVEV